MRRDQRGQATVELALALPILAAVLGAVVETGLLVADRARLVHAAREAARTAVVDPDPDAARAAAEATGFDELGMRIDPPPPYRVQGEALTVALTYRPPGRVPLLGELFHRIELDASATMRIEVP